MELKTCPICMSDYHPMRDHCPVCGAYHVIDNIICREGSKYTNDPMDRGGPTKFGITLADWSDYTKILATEDEIKNLALPQAQEFYRKKYVREPGFLKLDHDKWLQEFMVDTAVLEGIPTAIKMLQHVVGVKEDGIIGPITIEAVLSIPPPILKRKMLEARMTHLLRCALYDVPLDVVNTTQLRWLRGWLNRLSDFF